MGNDLRVAVIGATGHIGRALAVELAPQTRLTLYARRPEAASVLAARLRPSPEVRDLSELTHHEHDALVNCIGEGDPSSVPDPAVFDSVTRLADDLTLGYLQRFRESRLINISSGAAYCSGFAEPVTGGELRDECTSGDAYARAKRLSEVRHRESDSAVIDLRVFGFFSRWIDPRSTYFMADVLRSLRSGDTLLTGTADFIRDYIAPADLAALVLACATAGRRNTAYDVYSLAPVRKSEVLAAFVARFGLTYSSDGVTAETSGGKYAYYSLDRRAAELGYRPTRTSLEVLEEEADALLDMTG